MQTAAEYLDDRRLAGDPDAQPLPPIVIAAAAAGHDPDAPAPRAEAERAIEDAFEPLELEDDDVSALHASIDALVASSQSASSRDCWEVQITRTCFRSWRYLDRSLRRPVLRILRQLVTGREARGAVNHAKPLAHAEPGLALFESYLPRGWRLLWEETFAYSERYGCWRDMILLWDVCAHDGVEGRVRAISERFRRRRAAAAACTPPPPRPPERAPTAGGVRRPREAAEAARPAASEAAAAGEYTLELSALAAVEPQPAEAEAGPSRHRTHFEGDATAMAEVRRRAAALARAALAGRENRLEGEEACIAAAELDVICAEGPVLVVGRSGTGKTSCAVVRLWSLYHAYWSLGRGAALLPSGHLRTVFLTTNPMLLATVRRLVSDFESGHSLSAAGRATALDRDGDALPPLGRADAELPDALRSLPDDSYPLFVTGRKWLDLIDGTLVRPFFLRGADGAITERPGRLLEYDRFEEEVWQALAQGRSGVPHPMLVWTEFLSNIQGSVESLASAEDHLGLEQYLTLGRNRSRIDEAQRRIIHGLYGRYRSLKRQRGFYDVTDVVHHIYREVCAHGYSGPPIHEVIVDEVQDFTQAELALLIVVCGDPGGLFFCGDTCQTIARGVSFRFCDLRSLFHFEACVAGASRRALIACNQLPVRQLTKNYRSHGGILAASAVVVDMLELLFDREIDVLQRDTGPSPHRFCAALMRSGTGISAGPPPSLLLADDVQSLVLFLFGKERGQGRHLGADQVVVVRGEGARARLLGPLGRSNVLTVEEVKGLEFSDVLLFNFFADSPKGDERAWREAARAAESGVKVRAGAAAAAAGAQPEAAPMDFTGLQADGEAIEQARGRKRAAEEFDPYKHRLIATELKQLYTAMTRAKRAVWVYDESTKLRKPMFDLLASAGVAVLVDPNAEPTSPGGGRWAAGESRIQESSPEEWEKRGKEFMDRKLFEAAARAFENAGNKRLAALALAELELQRAAKIDNPKKKRSQILLAGKLFEESGDLKLAADAYELGESADKAKTLRALHESRAQREAAAASSRDLIVASAAATAPDPEAGSTELVSEASSMVAALHADAEMYKQTMLARLGANMLRHPSSYDTPLGKAEALKGITLRLQLAIKSAVECGLEVPMASAEQFARMCLMTAVAYDAAGRAPEAERWGQESAALWEFVEEQHGCELGHDEMKGAEAYFIVVKALQSIPEKAGGARMRAAARRLVAWDPASFEHESVLEMLLGGGHRGLHRLAVDDTREAFRRAETARDGLLPRWEQVCRTPASADAYIAEARLLGMSLDKHNELPNPGNKAQKLGSCLRLQPWMELDASGLCLRTRKLKAAARWARLAVLHGRRIQDDSTVALAFVALAKAYDARLLHRQALQAAKSSLALDSQNAETAALVQRLETLAAAQERVGSPPPGKPIQVALIRVRSLLERTGAEAVLDRTNDIEPFGGLSVLVQAYAIMCMWQHIVKELLPQMKASEADLVADRTLFCVAYRTAATALLMISEFGRRCGRFGESIDSSQEAIQWYERLLNSDLDKTLPMYAELRKESSRALILYARAQWEQDDIDTGAPAALDAALEAQRRNPLSEEIFLVLWRLLRTRESVLAPALKRSGAPHNTNLHLLEAMLRAQPDGEATLSRLVSGDLSFGEAGAVARTACRPVPSVLGIASHSRELLLECVSEVRQASQSMLVSAMLLLAGSRLDEAERLSRDTIALLDNLENIDTLAQSKDLFIDWPWRNAVWVCLSEVLAAQGRVPEAITVAHRAVQREPTCGAAHACLKRLEEAAAAAPLRAIESRESQLPASLLQSGPVLADGHLQFLHEADAEEEKGLLKLSNDAQGLCKELCFGLKSGAVPFARAAAKCGEVLPALSKKIQESSKASALAYFAEAELSLCGAIAHTAAGDAEAGERWAKQAVGQWDRLDSRLPGQDLRHKPAAAWLALAEACEKQGRPADALKAARLAASRDPLSFVVYDVLARLEGWPSYMPLPEGLGEKERAAFFQLVLERCQRECERLEGYTPKGSSIHESLLERYAYEANALYRSVMRHTADVSTRPGREQQAFIHECILMQGFFAIRAAEGALAAKKWKDAERYTYAWITKTRNIAGRLTGGDRTKAARRQLSRMYTLQAKSLKGRGAAAYALGAARAAAQLDKRNGEAAAIAARLRP